MYAEPMSEIIAHFIGVFDVLVEEARLRQKVQDGLYTEGKEAKQDPEVPRDAEFASNLKLSDYTPHLNYDPDLPVIPELLTFFKSDPEPWTMSGNPPLADVHMSVQEIRDGLPSAHVPGLPLYPAASQVIGHVTQLNLIFDDDVLNLTGEELPPRDLGYVHAALDHMSVQGMDYSVLAGFDRTDAPTSLQMIYEEAHATALQLRGSGQDDLDGTMLPQVGLQIALSDTSINGTWVNGEKTSEAPELDTYRPDALKLNIGDYNEDPSPGVHIDAGHNTLANIAGTLETSVMSPVMAVMGDYYQINAITQAFVYQDNDEVNGVGQSGSDTSIGMNVATFSHLAPPTLAASEADGAEMAFPHFWKVSVMEGDVVFLHWLDQNNFVSDNDTISVTTRGYEVSLVTGDNTAINLSSFLALGDYYDLVIVGGCVYNMNIISQLSVLYDNDTLHGDGYGDVSTSGNLIWNEALIQSIGLDSRFEAMPDYMSQVIDKIDSRVDQMPVGFSEDPTFVGYEGLRVLYITGDMYQVNYLKQTNTLGDADDATVLVQQLVSEGADVNVTVGDNTLINVAAIIDYNSLGDTTYIGGGVYSDSVLIQAGIVDDENGEAASVSTQLVNEVVAFLTDDHPADTMIMDASSTIQPDSATMQHTDAMSAVLV